MASRRWPCASSARRCRARATSSSPAPGTSPTWISRGPSPRWCAIFSKPLEADRAALTWIRVGACKLAGTAIRRLEPAALDKIASAGHSCRRRIAGFAGENVMAVTMKAPAPAGLSNKARELMEEINSEAGKHNVWVRTQANAPAQRPWFSETSGEGSGQVASGRVAVAQLKTQPYMWRWKEYSPYLQQISEIARKADVSPIEFADRQSILLLNPGLNGRLQVTNTIRCAISVYNPGDVAPVHLHSPNASRTILSDKGGYTVVEGERCTATRGDLILTPNGTWHDHGNDADEPVIWIDTLDWPLMEFLDAAWVDHNMPGAQGNTNVQPVTF